MNLAEILGDKKKSSAVMTFFKTNNRSDKVLKGDLWILLKHLFEILPEEVKSEISEASSEPSSQLESQKEEPAQNEKAGPSNDRSQVVQVCHKYRLGSCPHGLVGRECNYAHPKKCHRFKKFGSSKMDRRGCNRGKECNFFHPILCQASIKGVPCKDHSCTKHHLKPRVPRQEAVSKEGPTPRELTVKEPNNNRGGPPAGTASSFLGDNGLLTRLLETMERSIQMNAMIMAQFPAQFQGANVRVPLPHQGQPTAPPPGFAPGQLRVTSPYGPGI